MKTFLILSTALLFGVFSTRANDDPLILKPYLEGFSEGAEEVANEGALEGECKVHQGDGAFDVVEVEGRKAIKLSPNAESSNETSGLPCLVFSPFPQNFPQGVTFQARVRPDSFWMLPQCEILSARVSDRGTGMAITYRGDSQMVDVISGEGGADGNIWGIISDPQTKIDPDAWTHIVAVYDPEKQQFRLYINGERIAESETGLDLTPMSTDFTIGAYRAGYAYPFRGGITDIAVYDYVRTEEQIQKDAQSKE